MKFREIIEPNRSPRIETMIKLNDHTVLVATSDTIYAINPINNKIEEVEFEK